MQFDVGEPAGVAQQLQREDAFAPELRQRRKRHFGALPVEADYDIGLWLRLAVAGVIGREHAERVFSVGDGREVVIAHHGGDR